jgi:hypothetical protein
VTYDEAVRAADMFTAAMAEAGYPLEHPAWAYPWEGNWQYRWYNGSAPVEVRYKAASLVARAFGYRYPCLRCWIESGRGRDRHHCKVCADGNCPYDASAPGGC